MLKIKGGIVKMNKRIILKMVLVCLGIFLILTSTSIYFFSSKYELDIEKKYQVIIAAADIPVGEVITDEMVAYRTIKESGYNPHMVQNSGQVVGMKVLAPILKGDYIPEYDLLPPNNWYKDDDRTIVLSMDVESRLANLIKKGSLIDIRVEFKDSKTPPQTVLSKVFIEDILDENGLSLGENIGSKKAYAKVVLDKAQRDRIYVASQYGTLIYELYCDNTQRSSIEDFKIPPESAVPLPSSEQQSSSVQANTSAKEATP
jgi:Flp pilus assembly protein CpaB